jgi:uncharacterized protein YecT (DUF1311 family)
LTLSRELLQICSAVISSSGNDRTGGVMRFSTIVALSAALLMAACGRPQASCSSPDSQAALRATLRDSLERSVQAKSKDAKGKAYVGTSKIGAAIADLKLVVENIRTTREDPNSTRKFCTGNLKAVFGTQALADADKAREIAGMANLSSAADSADIERGPDYLQGDLDYSVQRTDDGSKVVVEIDRSGGKLNVFAEALAGSLLRPILESSQRTEQASMADKRRQGAQAAAGKAAVEQATTELRWAEIALTNVWDALPAQPRQTMTLQQTSWKERKQASCRLEGRQRSSDATEQQVATLKCMRRETLERVADLQEYLRPADE